MLGITIVGCGEIQEEGAPVNPVVNNNNNTTNVNNKLLLNLDFFGNTSDEIILQILVEVSKEVKMNMLMINDPKSTKNLGLMKENAECTMFAKPCPNATIHPAANAFWKNDKSPVWDAPQLNPAATNITTSKATIPSAIIAP